MIKDKSITALILSVYFQGALPSGGNVVLSWISIGTTLQSIMNAKLEACDIGVTHLSRMIQPTIWWRKTWKVSRGSCLRSLKKSLKPLKRSNIFKQTWLMKKKRSIDEQLVWIIFYTKHPTLFEIHPILVAVKVP